MMMALPFISFRPLIAALLHSVAWQPQTFYDPSQKRGEVPLAREQRKLAAMLAADVVGSSRLMGCEGSDSSYIAGFTRSPRAHPTRPSPTPDERALLAGYINAGATE